MPRHRPDALPSSFTGRLSLLAAALLASACAGYVEPKPGVYRERGSPEAEQTCSVEAPTGMMITRVRCRKTEDMPQESRDAQKLIEDLYVSPPPPR
jgi:hypothetical protein